MQRLLCSLLSEMRGVLCKWLIFHILPVRKIICKRVVWLLWSHAWFRRFIYILAWFHTCIFKSLDIDITWKLMLYLNLWYIHSLFFLVLPFWVVTDMFSIFFRYMKNSVYNIFEDVSDQKFPGFQKVVHEIWSSNPACLYYSHCWTSKVLMCCLFYSILWLQAVWWSCTQEQNEIIFVPSGWYHQVHNLVFF